MELIVGRKGQQPFTITNPAVSREHLKLTTLADGRVQVEDLNSTHGTYIDGLRIAKKVVSRDTVVRMGGSYTFCIKDVITAVGKDNGGQTGGGGFPPPPPPPPATDLEILKKFAQLEQVWEKYQHDKIALQKSNAIKGYMRMLPIFIMTCVGFLISCIPSLADYRLVITMAGLVMGGVLTLVAFKSAASMPEQMEKLNQQFQIDYVCPKCKTFLGFVPFQGLKNRGKCQACKVKLV